jgi:hypothetical protein
VKVVVGVLVGLGEEKGVDRVRFKGVSSPRKNNLRTNLLSVILVGYLSFCNVAFVHMAKRASMTGLRFAIIRPKYAQALMGGRA